jgi:hypothetical protein
MLCSAQWSPEKTNSQNSKYSPKNKVNEVLKTSYLGNGLPAQQMHNVQKEEILVEQPEQSSFSRKQIISLFFEKCFTPLCAAQQHTV